MLTRTDFHAADTESREAQPAESRRLHAESCGKDFSTRNSQSTRQQGGIIRPWEAKYGGTGTGSNWLEAATRLCRVDARVSNRVDRLKSLGNAIVPQVAYQIMKAIIELDREQGGVKDA
jgi:hypothetical protein